MPLAISCGSASIREPAPRLWRPTLGGRPRTVVQAQDPDCRIVLTKMGESGAAVTGFLGVTRSLVNRPAVLPESPDPEKVLNNAL